MDHPPIDASTTIAEHFRERIVKAWDTQGFPETEEYMMVQNYLCDLLLRFLRDDKQELARADLLISLRESMHSAEKGEAIVKIKQIADVSLLIASIFTNHQRTFRQITGFSHYRKTAQTAYATLHDRIRRLAGDSIIFLILARDIRRFIKVLVDAVHGVSMDEIVNVWQRFVSGADPSDLKWLKDQGIYIPDDNNIQ